MLKFYPLLLLLFAFFCAMCNEPKEASLKAQDAKTEAETEEQTGEMKRAKTPQRIVSMVPSLTEIVFALGAGERLVGVSNFCTYPPEAKEKAQIGGILNPNIETILALKPDLLFLMTQQTELKRKLTKLGLPILLVDTESMHGALRSITQVGERLGLADNARKLAANIRNEFNAIRNKTRNKKAVKTLIVIGHESGSLRDIWISAEGSFHDDILRIAGGVNMAKGSLAAYPKISKEEILKASPEAIVVLFDKPLSKEAKAKEIALWKPLGYIDAVKDNRLCIIDADWAHKPGVRMGKIAKAFYQCLHRRNEVTP